jgi:Fe-S-cluster containining protein
MRDGWVRRAVKAAARMVLVAETALARAVLAARGEPRYRLDGSCEGCGRCCETPTVAVGRLVWRFRSARALFVAWQRHVNGFVLLRRERDGRALVFRCTHYDPTTRRCDSYGSRPFMCRDYPRLLLYQPWPELFEDCTHRIVSLRDRGLRDALDGAALSDEQRAELRRRLRLE